jgi:hypothetical protein
MRGRAEEKRERARRRRRSTSASARRRRRRQTAAGRALSSRRMRSRPCARPPRQFGRPGATGADLPGHMGIGAGRHRRRRRRSERDCKHDSRANTWRSTPLATFAFALTLAAPARRDGAGAAGAAAAAAPAPRAVARLVEGAMARTEAEKSSLSAVCVVVCFFFGCVVLRVRGGRRKGCRKSLTCSRSRACKCEASKV